MIGDLDVIAPIETSFFCLSYACCNLACFVLSAMEAPNFRCEGSLALINSKAYA